MGYPSLWTGQCFLLSNWKDIFFLPFFLPSGQAPLEISGGILNFTEQLLSNLAKG
jgi:hypothetical protein